MSKRRSRILGGVLLFAGGLACAAESGHWPKPRPREDTAALLKQLGGTVEHTNLPPWPGIPTPTITAVVPD